MKVVAVVGRSLMASYKIEATRKAGWFEGWGQKGWEFERLEVSICRGHLV